MNIMNQFDNSNPLLIFKSEKLKIKKNKKLVSHIKITEFYNKFKIIYDKLIQAYINNNFIKIFFELEQQYKIQIIEYINFINELNKPQDETIFEKIHYLIDDDIIKIVKIKIDNILIDIN